MEVAPPQPQSVMEVAPPQAKAKARHGQQMMCDFICTGCAKKSKKKRKKRGGNSISDSVAPQILQSCFVPPKNTSDSYKVQQCQEASQNPSRNGFATATGRRKSQPMQRGGSRRQRRPQQRGDAGAKGTPLQRGKQGPNGSKCLLARFRGKDCTREFSDEGGRRRQRQTFAEREQTQWQQMPSARFRGKGCTREFSDEKGSQMAGLFANFDSAQWQPYSLSAFETFPLPCCARDSGKHCDLECLGMRG